MIRQGAPLDIDYNGCFTWDPIHVSEPLTIPGALIMGRAWPRAGDTRHEIPFACTMLDAVCYRLHKTAPSQAAHVCKHTNIFCVQNGVMIGPETTETKGAIMVLECAD